MRLIITDANILIDMHVGRLIEDMFRLTSLEFAVPDVLYLSELAEQHARLPGLGLKILSLQPDAIADAEVLRAKYRRPSMNDLFALALARAEACPLLSGDGSLRSAAEAENVEVHGTLWLVEQMRKELKLEVSRARHSYELMRLDGSRLPWDEVEIQLRHWRR